ncbi:hypothetical protein CC117_21885 [Parafrankia colletiae]|uniref:Uncharacterized protein n=1 Tax=Parafrankia colletiae TaxID=573497 RepID=A0A1S1QL38_9ACTN|nr:hypothetical protein [Parafrankia colletiae]MCK9899922.1 hypothetical protein [Frankia sp. Cpl3]OHV34279.1 hypothetical protein CC117_21885 [Parafrankia colletiae]
MLDLHPTGTVLREQSAGCGYETAQAARAYGPVASIDEVMQFYREVLPPEGWHLEFDGGAPAPHGSPATGRVLCFSQARSVEGVPAILSVWSDVDVDASGSDRLPSSDFGLIVTATREDENSTFC